MTKKNIGLAKSQVVRIHPNDRNDLKWIRKILKMSARHNEGDVIHQLIALFKQDFPIKKEGYVEQEVYDGLEQANITMKKTIDSLCEKQGITYAQAMELTR